MREDRDLLNDGDLQGDDLVAARRAPRGEYVAIIEAPRGTLTHHYRVDENDQVTMANLIVSTTCNNEPMNRAVRKIADDVISGVPEITEGIAQQHRGRRFAPTTRACHVRRTRSARCRSR